MRIPKHYLDGLSKTDRDIQKRALLKARKKYNVHDESNKYKNGDKVTIVECKPYSKNKKFEVKEL